MPWLPLRQFRDNAVPKLDNLRRAAAAGLRVPPTWWLPAAVAGQDSAGALPGRSQLRLRDAAKLGHFRERVVLRGTLLQRLSVRAPFCGDGESGERRGIGPF